MFYNDDKFDDRDVEGDDAEEDDDDDCIGMAREALKKMLPMKRQKTKRCQQSSY